MNRHIRDCNSLVTIELPPSNRKTDQSNSDSALAKPSVSFANTTQPARQWSDHGIEAKPEAAQNTAPVVQPV